jgi:Domain of unknown function (DUF3291)
MPTLPWKTIEQPQSGRDYVVMASRLPLASHRRIPAFLRATLAIRRQLATTAGLIGYGLDAHLLRRTFWTLSVWEDEAALDAFAHGQPHAGKIAQIRPWMAGSTFVAWTAGSDQLPVTWDQARDRVRTAT